MFISNIIAAALAAVIPSSGQRDDPPAPVGFKAQVAPILVRQCLGCHNDQKAEAGLNMATVAGLRAGGKDLGEGIIEPGDPEASYLIDVVRPGASPRMPYKQPPLSDAEIATLERWVREGAKLDEGVEPGTPLASLVNPLEGLPEVKPKVAVSDPIAAAAFSPDGAKLAAARGADVLLFDLASNRLAATLGGHPGAVAASRFTPDGSALVAAGGRPGMFGSIVVWDLATSAKKHDLRGHADAILAADLAPDGRTLATASYDRLVKLWDIQDGRELRTLKEHTDAVYGVAFSPDGSAVASAAGDRTVKLWDAATGRRRISLSDATAEQYAVAFGPDGRTLLAGGVDRTIRAWTIDGDTATLAHAAFAHDAPVLKLLVAPDGKTLISTSEDRRIKLWDLDTLAPRAALDESADWPLALALAPDGARLAVGLYDGSLALVEPSSGKPLAALLDAPARQEKPAESTEKKPELARFATLNPPSPRGGVRGTTVKVTIGGNGVGQARDIRFAEPGITATLLPREKPDPNAIDAEFTIAHDARPGVYSFVVRTPHGTPTAQTFAVAADPEAAESEPNDDTGKATNATLPATLVGTIEKPGDVDHVRFDAKAGEALVFDVLAKPLGSGLSAELTLLDADGKTLAKATRRDDGREPLLIYTPECDGPLVLRIADTDLGGSGNHFYRITAGAVPYVRSVFPLGAAPGESVAPRIDGVNLGMPTYPLAVGPGTAPGTRLDVPTALRDGSTPRNSRKVVVAEGPQAVESEPNDAPAHASALPVPGGLSGIIERPGDVDHLRFDARRGERWIVEVHGRRLGSPIDPAIEILDEHGQPIPRAVLRPVRETVVAFRDHPSTGRNIRLTHPWTGFEQGDYVLMGRELMRIHEMPRNPDDDAVFWGLGNPRNNTGERIAFLGTTPEHHPMNQTISKVEVHPPGTGFPPGGAPPVVLHYSNDDGGPGFDKDAMIHFEAPADGTYVVRVEDVRGLGGEDFGYHLVVRQPRPDFEVSLSTNNPNVPRGSSVVLPVNVRRIDGFDGPVDVALEGLPPGITATPARIEAEQYTADVLLTAAPDAPPFPESPWIVRARATIDEATGASAEHVLDPARADGGWITVTPEPNLKLSFQPERVAIQPGREVTMTLAVERRNGFAGRVPIDVRNLPFGVRVLHIGLNGVLVTESQTERTITLYAEPWVRPQERSFYAVGQCETAGTADSSAPIMLTVVPADAPPLAPDVPR
jgi:hypothetical protein